MSASSTSRKIFSITDCAKSGKHLSPIGSLLYLNLPKGVMIVHKSLLSSSNSKGFEKCEYPVRLRRISFIIGSGYCFRTTTLLSARKSLIQQILPSFFGIMKVGEAYLLAFVLLNTPICTRCFNSALKVSR